MASNQKNKAPEVTELKRERQKLAARDGAEAMAQYEAQSHAMREKTARLRSLRMERDAANPPAPPKKAARKKAVSTVSD